MYSFLDIVFIQVFNIFKVINFDDIPAEFLVNFICQAETALPSLLLQFLLVYIDYYKLIQTTLMKLLVQ